MKTRVAKNKRPVATDAISGVAAGAPGKGNWMRWIEALRRERPARVKMVVTLDLDLANAMLVAETVARSGLSVSQVLEATIIECDALCGWSTGDGLDELRAYASQAEKEACV